MEGPPRVRARSLERVPFFAIASIMNLLSELRRRFSASLQSLSGFDGDIAPVLDLIRPSTDPKFGDYQANCAMPLGKQLGRPPRDIAAELIGGLDVADLCADPEIAGPGFINLRLNDEAIVRGLQQAAADSQHLGVPQATAPRTLVVDYSSPNVAKPMHVGHIRSTVIGAAIANVLRYLGHRVITDNHIGDWGTQFGMIIYGYKHFADEVALAEAPVAELSRLYRLVHALVEYHAAMTVGASRRKRTYRRPGRFDCATEIHRAYGRQEARQTLRQETACGRKHLARPPCRTRFAGE